MNSVLAIAKNTFKEAVRNRILYLILFFALIMIGSSVAISQLTIAGHDKLIKDLGFASINLFGVAIAVFVGVSLVYNEIEKKTIYTIVSKPIDRWQFILGKFFGLLLTVYVNLLVMTVFFLFVLHYHAAAGGEGATWLGTVFGSAWKSVANLFWWNGFDATRNIMHVIFATMLELAIITSFAILYSSFTTPTLSMAFTVMTFIAGRMNEDLIAFAEFLAKKSAEDQTPLPLTYYFAQGASLIFPNLGVFHRTVDQALYQPEVTIWWESVLYAAVYPSAVLFLAMLIFGRRNFK